ncbi:MAG TPA: hypothetical protein VN842_04185 [Thermoplasmata archaeon]|nr:hypothetical protein [Thermoplasmata archaeon]
MRTGPEALMVQSRMALRGNSAELARLEYAYEDIRVAAAGRPSDPDDGPTEPSAVGELVLRAQAWLRARAAPGDAQAVDGEAGGDVLAALPVRTVVDGPPGAPAPIWAIPLVAMIWPEGVP